MLRIVAGAAMMFIGISLELSIAEGLSVMEFSGSLMTSRDSKLCIERGKDHVVVGMEPQGIIG